MQCQGNDGTAHEYLPGGATNVDTAKSLGHGVDHLMWLFRSWSYVDSAPSKFADKWTEKLGWQYS